MNFDKISQLLNENQNVKSNANGKIELDDSHDYEKYNEINFIVLT
jgi:hypothetical protein